MKDCNEQLFYEWNATERSSITPTIEINDDTLRDGIQAVGIRQPTIK